MNSNPEPASDEPHCEHGWGECAECPPGPSVVTPAWDFDPDDESVERVTLVDAGPDEVDWPPAAPSVSTDITDETLKAELLHLCVPVQFSNGYPIEAIPKAALLDWFALRALESRRG